jgi:ATP-dependent protease Clp ATPase subunit
MKRAASEEKEEKDVDERPAKRARVEHVDDVEPLDLSRLDTMIAETVARCPLAAVVARCREDELVHQYGTRLAAARVWEYAFGLKWDVEEETITVSFSADAVDGIAKMPRQNICNALMKIVPGLRAAVIGFNDKLYLRIPGKLQ